ncbi:DUF6053 domain-containing protein [Lysobacter enzymogenes]
MGRPSGPMPFDQIAASRHKSLGPEGPPTRAEPGPSQLGHPGHS